MIRRAKPFASCAHAAILRRTKLEILLRQKGHCADCGTRLDVERIIFDHRPPLALRSPEEDPNDPEGLAAICPQCDRLKTSRDLAEIARTRRLALDRAEHETRMAAKVCGRPRLSRHAERALKRYLSEDPTDRVRAEEVL
jgi:5-methylcytosine-specific restriction endonuclease McrA